MDAIVPVTEDANNTIMPAGKESEKILAHLRDGTEDAVK